MDIQETAKRLMEGAEDMAKSAATKPKFTHSAKGGKHKDSEGLEGSTQGMPPEGDEEETFNSNVSSKESQRPTDEKMPGKTAGKLRKKDSMVDPDSEVDVEIDYLATNPGKAAASGIRKITKLTSEDYEEGDEEIVNEADYDHWKSGIKSVAKGVGSAFSPGYASYKQGRRIRRLEQDIDAKLGNKKQKRAANTASSYESFSMENHLDALYGDLDLTEDFKDRVSTIFEAAVNERVVSISEELESLVEAKLAAAIEENKEEMANNLDSYLNYVVEEWMKENEVAIERGLRNEITEEFLSGLRNLFLEHNIDVPESKVDVLEKMAERIEELEESLNAEIENNIALRERVETATKRDVVEEIGSDLTASERVKLRKLLEGVTAESHEDFVAKAVILKENYFAEGIEPIRNTEEGIEDLQPNYLSESNDTMSEYLKALNRMGRK